MAPSIDGFKLAPTYAHAGRNSSSLALLLAFNRSVVLTAAFYAGLSWAIDFQPGVFFMLMEIAIILLNLICTKYLENYVLSVNIYLISNCLVAVLGCSWYSGGILSPVAPWFATGPITAVLLLGMSTNALLLIGLNFLCIGVLAVAAILNMGLPVRYDTRYSGLFFALCQIGLAAFVLIHTRMFYRAESRALQASERSNYELREAMVRAEAATRWPRPPAACSSRRGKPAPTCWAVAARNASSSPRTRRRPSTW